MNLVLLTPDDFISEDRVRIAGRRLRHIQEVHRAAAGDELNVGLVDGLAGKGRILTCTPEAIEMAVSLKFQPPPPLPVTLLLALPRPKMLKRVLFSVASLGVKSIFLINSCRVEKSFWQSPLLNKEQLNGYLMLGLEQAKDTVLPGIHLRPFFKPFCEDELPSMVKGTLALAAHPAATEPCPHEVQGHVTLAIGPEGGFIQYEIEKLASAGFTPVSMGQRILRVETAVPALLARLF